MSNNCLTKAFADAYLIFNYDQDNGIGLNFKNKKQNISEEASKFFKDLEKLRKENPKVNIDFDDFVKGGNLADETLVNFIKTTDNSNISLDKYQTHLKNVGKTSSTVGTTLKSLGGSALSFLGNMGVMLAVSKGIELAVTAIDNYVHKSEKLIEKGEEARSSIRSTFDEFSKGKTNVTNLGKSFAESQDDIKTTNDAIDSVAEKYVELSKGVNRFTNENKSLSTDGYQDYLNICNQLAEQFPTLVSGYDAQGNAILNLSNNAIEASVSLRELYDSQMLTANAEIGKNLQDDFDGAIEQIKVYKDENKKLSGQIKSNKENIKDIQGIISVGSIKDNKGITYDADALGAEISGFKDKVYEIFKKNGLNVNEVLTDDGLTHLYTSGEISNKVAKELNTELSKITSNAAESLALDNNEMEKTKSANKALIKQQWDEIADSVGSYLQTSKSFTGLNQGLQSALLENLNDLNLDSLTGKYDGDVKKFLQGEFIVPLSELKPDVQEKLADLINIDKSTMSLEKYRDTIEKTLKEIFPNDKDMQKSFKDKLGLSDIIKDSQKKFNELSKVYGDGISKLSLDDLDKTYELAVQDGFSSTFEELNQKIQKSKELAATAIDLKANTKLDAIGNADQSANSGDDYKKAVEYAKQAKEMFDQGLIGTDDFKSRASYYSPTGADDAVNFAENYGKISRYMTDDISGVQHFLNDLKDKGYATFETLSDGTQKWSYDIDDLESAASDMSMGFEWFMDMFGRLEDYGFSNNFVGSVEDGAARITELSSELVEAQAELSRLEATGADSTAIEQQKEKIAGLQSDIAQTQSALDQLVAHSAEKYNQQIESAKQAITSLKTERDKVLKENTYGENTDEIVKLMDDKIKSLAQENGITLDAELNIVNKESIQDGLNSEQYKLNVDYTDLDGLQKKANESWAEVQKLVSEKSSVKINVQSEDMYDIQSQIDAVKYALEGLRNEDGTVNIHEEGAQELLDVLHALYAQKIAVSGDIIMRLPTDQISGDVGAVIGKLQEFEQAYNELQELNTLADAGVNVDTSEAESKLENIASELQNLPQGQADVLANLNIDPKSVDSISSTISSIDAKALVKVGVDSSLVEKYTSTEKKGKGKVKWENDTKLVDTYAGKTKRSSGVVAWSNDTKNVKKNFYATGTIAWSNSNGSGNNKKNKNKDDGTAGVNGTAHAHGTVRKGNSFVNGNWGVKHSGNALVGEMGRELLVRGSNFTTIGDNGAEFVNIRSGDIIFNHKQTEELLKSGYVTSNGGRGNLIGNSFFNGSAYAGGSGGGGFYGGGSGSNAHSGSSYNSSSTKSSSSDKSSEKSEKASEKIIDFVEIAIKRLEEGIKRIKITAESAFKTFTKRNEALGQEMSAIVNKINLSQQAYNKYISQANSVGLSESYASQVRNGSINIATITDEDLSKKISDYQEW